MSFPKAKIQRFNDIKATTPSPADYNIKTENASKYGTISQSERFLEPQSPSRSDTSSNLSVTFRTPNLPKKKRALSFSTKIGTKQHESAVINEELREKIVECNNKDLFIKELNEQIEEMKQKMAELEQHKSEFNLNKQLYEEQTKELQEQHQKQIQNEEIKYKTEIERVNAEIIKINEEQSKIKQEYDELKTTNRKEIVNLLGDIEKFQGLHSRTVEEYKSQLKKQSDLIETKEAELKILEEKSLDLKRKHSIKIESLQRLYKSNIKSIKLEIIKSIEGLQELIQVEKDCAYKKIKEIQSSHDKELIEHKQKIDHEKEELMKENEARIKLIEENFKEVTLLSEIQTKQRIDDIENNWKLKLEEQEKQAEAILKECQEISEYSIIESELEKNGLKQIINKTNTVNEELKKENDEITNKYKLLETNYKNLQNELSQIIVELNDTRKLQNQELEQQKLELQKVTTEKRAYQITITTSQETIEVLKKRLINSDRDVEQLKEELANCETKILELENKNGDLISELKQTQTANEELEMQYESSLKLTAIEVDATKIELLGKIEELKKQIVEQTQQLDNEKSKFNDIYSHLTDQQKLNVQRDELLNQLSNELEQLEASNKNYEETNQELKTVSENLEQQLKQYENKKLEIEEEERVMYHIKEDKVKQIQLLQEKCDSYQQHCEYYKIKLTDNEREIEEAAEIRKKYIEQSGKYDELLQKFEALQIENEKQKEMITMQETLIGPFREQLEAYEFEHNILLNEKRCMENEVKEIGLKYAAILGHQNHKQKIKHLIDLKARNLELKQSNSELESKLASYKNVAEKLKKENLDLKKSLRKFKPRGDDKENLSSPNVSLNSSRVESPGPLKERN